MTKSKTKLKFSQVKKLINETDSNTVREILEDTNKGIKFLQAVIELQLDLNDINDYYVGEYDSDESFVRELLVDDIAGIPSYITVDWEAISKDIMNDYVTCNDFYFRCY